MMRLSAPVILASGSPRRLELLREIFPDFEVLVSNVDEEALTVSDPYATAESLAQAKARAVLKLRPDALVIGGDTVVAVPDGGNFIQLSKPASISGAEQMLSMLSDRTHLVITGVCLAWKDGEDVFSDTSKVTFRTLHPKEIKRYVSCGESMDKAGGYAIQGGASSFVESLEGSISNVVGLPLEALRSALDRVLSNKKVAITLLHSDRDSIE